MKEPSLALVIGLLMVINGYAVIQNTLLAADLARLQQTVEDIRESLAAHPASGTHTNRYPPASSSGKAASVVTESIPLVAVSQAGEGVVGHLSLKLIPGNNNVLVNTNPFLDTDIQYTTNKAVAVAKTRADYAYDKDFIFTFGAGDARLIGGGSAGAATAILTLAALQGTPLSQDAVITGTINPDGTIGRVGGILEKAKAAADANYTYFLVPEEQVELTFYEQEVVREPVGFGLTLLNKRYVPKTVDLAEVGAEEWGLTVVGVATLEDALPYFMEETR